MGKSCKDEQEELSEENISPWPCPDKGKKQKAAFCEKFVKCPRKNGDW